MLKQFLKASNKMRQYIDKSFFVNPISIYFKWLFYKSKYQLKYWGKHLRIGYGTMVVNCTFNKYNTLGVYNLVINCNIDSHTYLSYNSVVLNTTFGKFCSIGPNATIGPGTHPASTFVSTHPSTYQKKQNYLTKCFADAAKFESQLPVTIGNDVWIGANVLIIGGVTIADGAIVAANSVVTSNVKAYEIVGGTPAKFIKKRFKDEEIELLSEIRWWDKDELWIKKNIVTFWNIEHFYNTHK